MAQYGPKKNKRPKNKKGPTPKPGTVSAPGAPKPPGYENKLTKRQRKLYGNDNVVGSADLKRFTKSRLKGKDLSGKKRKKFESKIEKKFVSGAKSLLKPQEGQPLKFRAGRKFHESFGVGLTRKAHRERREAMRKAAGKPALETTMDEWMKGRNKEGWKIRQKKKNKKNKNKNKGAKD